MKGLLKALRTSRPGPTQALREGQAGAKRGKFWLASFAGQPPATFRAASRPVALALFFCTRLSPLG